MDDPHSPDGQDDRDELIPALHDLHERLVRLEEAVARIQGERAAAPDAKLE